jgi:DNA recombination protein RmuC
MAEWMTWTLLAVGGLNLLLLLALWLARPHQDANAFHAQQMQQHIANSSERLERELRTEITDTARGGRQELIQTLGTFQQTLVQQSAEATRTQNSQMDAFAQQLE